MARALPKEVREKIIKAYENNLGTVFELAEIFDVTPRSIYNYLRQYKETGDLTPQTQPGRPPIMTEDMLEVVKNIVLSNPDGTL